MRLSLGLACALAAALSITIVFWPEAGTGRGPARAFAQEQPKLREPGLERPLEKPIRSEPPLPQSKAGEEKADDAVAKERRSAAIFRLKHEHPLSSDTGRNARIEAALDETVNLEIEPQSLRNALNLLAEKFRIAILIDQKTLDDANVDVAQEVKLSATGLTLRDTLAALLHFEVTPLSFEIHEGTLLVSTVDKIKEDLQVVVYDCRDLAPIGTLDHYPLEKSQPGGGGGMGGGGGVFQAPEEAGKPAVPVHSAPLKPAVAPAGPALVRPGARGAPPVAPAAPAAVQPQASPAPSALRLPLVQTIIASLDQDSWDDGATITEFGGLLVVRQNPINHEKIKALLSDIRRMRETGAFADFAKPYEVEANRREAQEAKRSAPASKRRQPTSGVERPESHPAAPLPATAK
jgi:hypothetical protein